VGKRRPGLWGPRAERTIAQSSDDDAGNRVDPEKRPGLSEVAERPGRVAGSGPVRVLLVPDLDAEAPVVGVLASESRQHTGQAREGDPGGPGDRGSANQGRRQELLAQPHEVADAPGHPGRG